MVRAAAVLRGVCPVVLSVCLAGMAAPLLAQTSNQQNPVQVFATPGPHDVTLTVCNSGGCSQVTKTVQVLDPRPAVVSAATSPVTVEAGQLVPLSGSGTGKPPLTYTWRVLDGNSLVQEIPGALAWWNTRGIAPGTYTLALRIQNAFGQAESTLKTVTVVPQKPADFYTVSPCRVFDTRATVAGALASGAPRLVTFGTSCGIPAGARAVAVNVTVLAPSAQGNVAFYPGTNPNPGTSTINFPPDGNLANNAILPLDVSSSLAMVATLADRGAVDLLIDVAGYFLAEPAP